MARGEITVTGTSPVQVPVLDEDRDWTMRDPPILPEALKLSPTEDEVRAICYVYRVCRQTVALLRDLV